MLEKSFKLCQRTLVKYANSFKILNFLKPGRGRPTPFDDKSKMRINYGRLINTVTEVDQ